MGSCKDCRWWDADGPTLMVRPTTHACRLMESRPTDSTPLFSTTKAIAWSDRYSGEVLTEPDFGCVQYQAKEPG